MSASDFTTSLHGLMEAFDTWPLDLNLEFAVLAVTRLVTRLVAAWTIFVLDA